MPGTIWLSESKPIFSQRSRSITVATVWLTYAWADNDNQDVDYAAQELTKAGVQVKLDRWTIGAGKRLWEQIEHFICNPDECDAWILYATQNSLGSQPCKEEYAYALERALQTRGGGFPVIGVFPGSVDNQLIPAGIRTRLYVGLTDPDWKERIVAAAEERGPDIPRSLVEPFMLKIHQDPRLGRKYVVEMRPRAGSWAPFVAAIPIAEEGVVKPQIRRGPKDNPRNVGAMLTGYMIGTSRDEIWWFASAQEEATPTQSYYLFCDQLPTKLAFGVYDGEPVYTVSVGP